MSPRAKVQAGGILRKSADVTWQTPEFVLERVRAYFGGEIPFDPATARDNPTKATRFCAGPAGTLFAQGTLESSNGLEVAWDLPFWVNPPFAKAWIQKIGAEGARRLGPNHSRRHGLALLPCNRFEEPYMQSCLAASSAVCFVDAKPFQPGLSGRRLAFVSSVDGEPCDANPFASMILGFQINVSRFTDTIGELGVVFEWHPQRRVPKGASS